MNMLLDVNYFIGLAAIAIAGLTFSLYCILFKVQVKLMFLRTLFPNRNYGTVDIVEKGGAVFTYVASYIPPDFKNNHRTFIFPTSTIIPRRWGAPYTLFYFNDGSEPITRENLQELKNPDAKPGDKDYGAYMDVTIKGKPDSANPRSITSYLVQFRGLDRELEQQDRQKKQETPILLYLGILAAIAAGAIAAYFAYTGSDAAIFCAKGVSTVLNMTR